MSHEVGPIDDKFLEVVFAEDELGTVVRAHIMIEAQVHELLDMMLPFPERIPRLRFEQKVKLLTALGLSDRLFPPLAEIGNIRNSFGHHIDTKLTNGMVVKWFQTFPAEDRNSMQSAYEKGAKEGDFSSTNMLEADPKGLFRLLAVGLRQMLKSAQAELKNRQMVQ